MGCGMSSEDKEGKERNEQIENQLKRDKMSQRNEIKMLLLGKITRHRSHVVEADMHTQGRESLANRLSSSR